MRAIQRLRKLVGRLVDDAGSTRPLGLFRIILVLLLWARLAEDLALWNARSLTEIAVGSGFFLLTVLALVGWQTRRVMPLLAANLALVYFHLGHNLGHAPFTHHHVYLLFSASLLCALGPCGQSFSLDRWLALGRGVAMPESGPLTANHLLRLQLAAVYFWTAVDKTNVVFLSGTRLEQILLLHYHETMLEPMLLWPAFVVGASIAVVAVEYFLAAGVLFRRWLPAVFILGAALHCGFYLLLPVQTFSATMLAMYLFLLRPQDVHRAIDRLVSSEHPTHSVP